MKRLSQATGSVEKSEDSNGTSDRVTREAILVHAGPGGEKISFACSDGEVSFDDGRIKNIVNANNSYLQKLAEQYGGLDKMLSDHMGAFPPLLDQHADDSNNRIVGRLASEFKYERRDVPKIGKDVPCVIASTTFLGEENVKKVKDGRIYHLSVGIDENSDLIGEVSIVIDPAAPGAMLLEKGKISTKGKGELQMSKKKLAKAKAERLTKLSAMHATLTNLDKKIDAAKEQVRLAARQGDVESRFVKLMKAKKMTPAEFKKLSVAKLAKLDDDSLETIVSTYEAREDVISPNQRGTSDAPNASEIAQNLEKKQWARLKNEARKDIMRMGKKLKEDAKDEYDKELSGPKEYEDVPAGRDPHAVEGEMKLAKQHLEEMKQHLEAGDIEKAKEVHAKMSAYAVDGDEKHLMGDVKSEDYQMSMANMQKDVDEVKTELARMAGMVHELIKGEEDEDAHLEHEVEEDIKK